MSRVLASLAVVIATGVLPMLAQQRRSVEPVTLAALTAPPADSTTIRVRNFWATWCKPCIEEMPIFDTLARRYREIRIELVSVDSPRDSAKVRSFWQRRGYASVRVLHLRQELRSDDIDAIAPEWSGAIPMTIIERGSRRIVHEGQLDLAALEALIKSIRK